MIIKEEKINLGRQRELDLAKAFAIIFMVVIHVYEELYYADVSEICSQPFDVLIQFLGGPLAAPMFMFSLGLGLSYSSHRSPEELMKRGLRIFLLSYVFNIIRFTIPYFISEGFAGVDPRLVIYSTFHVDILPFAGLTFMLTGFLKKLKLSVFGTLAVAVVMQGAGILIATACEFNSLFSVFFFGLFVKTGVPSYFPLFQWYIYPAFGLVFAKYLRHIEDTDKLYRQMLGVSASLMFSFCTALYLVGYDVRQLFTLTDELYYMQTFLHSFFSLGCIALELSIAHFALKGIHLPKLDAVIKFMSNNLNNIYIAQWIIIGWLSYFAFTEEAPLSAAATVPLGLLLAVVSSLIVKCYLKLKKSRKVKAAS